VNNPLKGGRRKYMDVYVADLYWENTTTPMALAFTDKMLSLDLNWDAIPFIAFEGMNPFGGEKFASFVFKHKEEATDFQQYVESSCNKSRQYPNWKPLITVQTAAAEEIKNRGYEERIMPNSGNVTI
jgi:hypothetical protein